MTRAPNPSTPLQPPCRGWILGWGMWQRELGTACCPHILSVPSRLPGKGEWGVGECFLPRAVGAVCDFLSQEGEHKTLSLLSASVAVPASV